MKQPVPIDLYLESSSDYRITQVRGKETATITPLGARDLWSSGKVRDCNIAFRRLAEDFNFDVEAIKAYYKQQTK